MRAAFTCALLLALASPALAFRTSSDVYPELAGTERVRWSGPIEYDIHASGGPGVSPATILAQADYAFGRWSALECAQIESRYGSTTSSAAGPDDGRNTLSWVDLFWTDRGFPPDAVATTDLNFTRGSDGVWRLSEADLYFNAEDYQWSPTSGTADGTLRSLRSVLLHEAGHAIGLAHPCEPGGAGGPDCASDSAFRAAIMFPLYQGPEYVLLGQDDEAGACFLYGCEQTGCPAGLECGVAGCGQPCGNAVCAPNEECTGGACSIPMTGCGTDADCPGGERCSGGLCIATGGATGDPCAAGGDCASGVCSGSGACTYGCASASCPAGFTCEAEVCEPSGGVLGDPCTSADDCATRLCASSESRSSCTRDCNADRPCPSGFTCADASGRNVCLPDRPPSCAASPLSGSSSTLALTLIAALVVLSRRRLR